MNTGIVELTLLRLSSGESYKHCDNYRRQRRARHCDTGWQAQASVATPNAKRTAISGEKSNNYLSLHRIHHHRAADMNTTHKGIAFLWCRSTSLVRNHSYF